MAIKYLKKSPKQPSTDDLKTREVVQKLLTELEKKFPKKITSIKGIAELNNYRKLINILTKKKIIEK